MGTNNDGPPGDPGKRQNKTRVIAGRPVKVADDAVVAATADKMIKKFNRAIHDLKNR